MIVDELTHEDIWQALEHLRDFCTCRDSCVGCFYSGDYKNSDGNHFAYCAISHNPNHWQTDIVKMHVEAEEAENN